MCSGHTFTTCTTDAGVASTSANAWQLTMAPRLGRPGGAGGRTPACLPGRRLVCFATSCIMILACSGENRNLGAGKLFAKSNRPQRPGNQGPANADPQSHSHPTDLLPLFLQARHRSTAFKSRTARWTASAPQVPAPMPWRQKLALCPASSPPAHDHPQGHIMTRTLQDTRGSMRLLGGK